MINPKWTGTKIHVFPRWLGGTGELLHKAITLTKSFVLRVAREVGFRLER